MARSPRTSGSEIWGDYDHLQRWDRSAMLDDLGGSTWCRPSFYREGRKGVAKYAKALLLCVLCAAFASFALKSCFAAAPTTSPQWVDVTANGADPTGAADATAAINTSIASAIAGGQPLYFPYGTYKVSSPIAIDYVGVARSGFRLISDGATLNGLSIAAGPVLQVKCSGGMPGTPAACFYFKEEGTLFVNGNTPSYVFLLGKTDFSDQHNSAKIDHLIVNNASIAAGAGGCQFNTVYDGDFTAICVTAGGAAGWALEQTQFSLFRGAATAQGTGGRGLVLENGYDFSDTFTAVDLEVSPICLSITSPHNGLNTWVSPYFDCNTAVSATASLGNTLVNPNYGGHVVNYGPASTGISIVGTGSRNSWLFPNGNAYTAAPVDDGLSLSSYNASGAALAVTLPAVAAVNTGWSMGFASDNGKGMTISVPDSARILSGGLALGTMNLGSGNYEYVKLQSDGNNWRVLSMTRNTRLANDFEPPPWPSRWLYPSTSGYAAVAADNGNTISSYNAGAGGLTVTLPSTTGLTNGWSMGFATDNGHSLTVQVNASSGGHILHPGVAVGGLSSVTMASGFPGQIAYEAMVLQYDGSGNFRIVSATPATAGQLDMLGTAGINRWSFPSASTAYTAAIGDNGNAISSYNSPGAFMAVTLPSTTAINQGWTIGIISDNGKTMSVQVNGVAGGAILLPGSLGSTTPFSLWQNNYENAVLEFDGSNFRVVSISAASLAKLGGLMPTGTIASSSTPCQTGAIQFDSNYVYACTGPNTWKRAALAAY
jgi:hypothetical protein